MKVVIYLYPGVTVLDAMGPHEVLRGLKEVEIQLVAKKRGEIHSDTGAVHFSIKHDFSTVHEADLLLIPGSTVAFVREMRDKEVLAWVKKIDDTTKVTATVCTGSLILAATGRLSGRRATSHWKPIQLLEKLGATPVRERWVKDGKYYTAAGVSAGIDLSLQLVADLCGPDHAKATQLTIEYDPHPPFSSGNAQTAEPTIRKLAEQQMERDAQRELSMVDIVKNAGTLWKLKKG